jgi:hypothetical protein
MARWTFTQRYRSSYGAGNAGDVVELDDEVAAAIERDSPGTLKPVVETRQAAEPAATRQVTKPAAKRSEG